CNEVRYRSAPHARTGEPRPVPAFFHALDALPGVNRLHGRGGHAATPHLAVDPVVAAAAVVMRLQAVVARETAPADQVTVTVGTLHAGTAPNVIPDRAELGVGVRAS
ncbi:peptidase dimerization domain-containing protein, partial [Streptomyces sp. NRRL S-1896]|uniref:peptidase dimerization domain-containing protein n=1 Tax=Streptomyces sp. NRRL S-1896 TaxID=1463893 RepID=UPI0004CD831B